MNKKILLGKFFVKTTLILLTFSFLLFIINTPVYALLTGDVNNDSKVNIIDIGIVIDNYGKSPIPNPKADVNNDGRVDIIDIGLVIDNYGKTESSGTPTDANITLRHPYPFGTQPALDYEKFNMTFWINNWDVKPGGKSIRALIEKTGVKSVSDDELSTPWMTYVASGAKTYLIKTCDTPIQTVLDKDYFTKDPIAVSGLEEGGFYKITLELKDENGTPTGINTSACVEVNRQLLTSLVHVNETSGTSSGGGNPAYFNTLKQQISQAMTELGDIPPCPNHDPTKYHAIYDPVRKCHYDHEHKDDPNRSYYDNPNNPGRDGPNRGVGDVLSVFGPLWAWLPDKDKAQLPVTQTVSYPWQTWSGLDIGSPPPAGKMENDVKHNGYVWLTRTPDDFGNGSGNCVPLYNTPNCITHFREEIHALSGMPDALTHTHSFWLEARVCKGGTDGKDNSQCGIYRGGGHVGFGRFGTTRFSITTPGQQELLPFFYTDGPSATNDSNHNGTLEDWEYYYLRPDGTHRDGGIRLHGGMAPDDVHANAKDFTWYPEGRPSMVAIVGSSFGPLLYTPNGVTYDAGGYHLVGPEWSQIRRQVYYCADPTKCRWPNGAQKEAHFVILRVPNAWDGAYFDEDKSKNGYLTFHGYTNRWGDLLTNHQCDNSPLGADCIPTVYDHVPTADADTQHRDSSSNVPMYNYDIAPSGKYWIQFPD